MPISRTLFVLVFSAFVLSANISFAASGVREPMERFPSTRTQELPDLPEVKSFEGSLHCKDHGTPHVPKCRLQLLTKEGEEFNLIADDSLRAAVLQKNDRHLYVKLQAEREDKFLFWGGGLKVLSYQVVEDSSGNLCAKAKEEASAERFQGPRLSKYNARF